MMKAVLCDAYGPIDNLRIADVPIPELKPGHVRIDIKAAGLNFPDILMIMGMYQASPQFPFIPGSELSGVVEAIGEGVTHLKVGDRVTASVPTGAFAEKIVIPAYTCLPLGNKLDFETASCFLITYGTAYHALKDRAHIQENESLLVLGAAGGVGQACLDLARLMKVESIAVASTEEKLELCRSYGASHTINYRESELRQAIKGLNRPRKNVDVVFDPVGGKYSELALRSLAYGGRHLVIGFAAGKIPKIPLNLPLLKACQIVGVFWGHFAQRFAKQAYKNHIQLIEWIHEGKLKPYIQKTFPLGEVKTALKWIAARKVMGKVVLSMKD